MMSATAAGTAPDRREINEEVGEFVMVEYCTLIQPAEQNETGRKCPSRQSADAGIHPVLRTTRMDGPGVTRERGSGEMRL